MPRDPRGLLRGLSEPWVIPETGVRGWLTPTPSGRVSDRTALLLLCATDTEVLATRASWRSEQQWPGFASRRIWPKTEKGKTRSGQQANGFVALRLRSVTTHLMLGYSCSCRATLDAWEDEADPQARTLVLESFTAPPQTSAFSQR